MIKGLAAWVLNNYLGKYVENLNTDQLSIAISQGLVELENLPLRKDALRQYGVPIEVRAGFVGKVKLQIPVRQIWSAPWSICIEQLYLVAGPVTLSQWDQEAEERAALEYKLGVLDALEAAWRAQADNPTDTGYYASSYSAWMSYGTGLVTSIIENLQLHIKDVHVRYEDETEQDGFACGITVESLTARSCDSSWLPRFVASGDPTAEASFKEVELCSLAVYWDPLPPDKPLGGLSLGELAVAMSNARGRSFLLAPVSARARVSHDRSPRPLRSRTHPRIVCDLGLELVTLELADRQYGQMVRCFKGLQMLERSRRHRKWRPAPCVCEDPRAWWAYACGCLVRGLRGNALRSWDAVLHRARENVGYVAACSRLLANPSSALPADARRLKDTMEADRSLDELRALREAAMRRARPPATPPAPPPRDQGRGLLLQWFPQWWGWSSPPDPGVDPKESRLEDELLDALADTVENNSLLRRDTVFAQFNFSLGRGTVHLCAARTQQDSRPLLELSFEAMQLGLEYRPRTSSHQVTVSLGSLSLRDRLTQDSMFPNLISPLARDGPGQRFRRTPNRPQGADSNEPLFRLAYEYRPFNSSAHYRLHVCTQSLDMVYNPGAVSWLADFFTRPHQDHDAQLRMAARHRYERMKQRTKQELIRNWEKILQGHLSDRKTWEIELDISAPQIILVEHFCDKNAVIAVVDFGRFHFSNTPETNPADVGSTAAQVNSDDEDEEAFMTPCSTPPASEASDDEAPTVYQATPQKSEDVTGSSSFNDNTLHDKLYDRYKMELSELQVLVGRVRDNWKYAHMKTTSTLHVLDRFNISLRVERRLVFTSDPHFPSLTLAGNLPQLVVHVNEHKVEAVRTIVAILGGRGLPSPFRSPESVPLIPGEEEASGPEESPESGGQELSRLLMVQFTVDQLQLEVQSRGRSVAELQVSGVKATFMKRPFDTNVSLSVHSLLLVDALQTFGPDFELLVASHKHVGMDSVSGSLRDSEPTSPTSPGSPDPGSGRSVKASPTALTRALSSLQTDSTTPATRAVSPTWNLPSPPACPTSPPPCVRPPAQMELLDAEALITVDIVLVSRDCPSGGGEALQLATIQCNNLDIIANQETIVELMGFARRVFPQLKSSSRPMPPPIPTAETSGSVSPRGSAPRPGRTEITFDFHRLNVLLLRGVNKEGRKIATATMAEASIKATVGVDLEVEGSLGGLQVLDLTPGGRRHQRILSLGKDPLVESTSTTLDLLGVGLYSMSSHGVPPLEEKRAFSFSVRRAFASREGEEADVKVRMASVWYTHSPLFLLELQSCATEFKQYLANLARSIRVAATEMAIGLVHARAEALANTFSMNTRLPSSLYGSATELSTPTRRPRYSFSQSSEMLATPNTPYSPGEEEDVITSIRLDVVLDTPVVVMPRRADSGQVFVAHLGQISVNNAPPPPATPDDEGGGGDWGAGRHETYSLEVKDMNLYSLDTEDDGRTSHHPRSRGLLVRAEEVYSCATRGRPILHNTVVRLVVERDVGRSVMKQSDSFPTLLLGEDGGTDFLHEKQDVLQITGSVVTGLKVSLSRQQYEQLLETVDGILSHLSDETAPAPHRPPPPPLGGIQEEEGVTELNMDPSVRAKVQAAPEAEVRELTVKVTFELPVFTVELRADLGSGEQGLVDLSFQDFNVQYNRSHRYETNIQMSLRSLLMEDLLRPPDSKHRCIVVSSSVQPADRSSSCQAGVYVSRSCPDLVGRSNLSAGSCHGSLPDHLEARRVLGAARVKPCHMAEYPCTPPPSPLRGRSPPALHRDDNLVRINVTLVDVGAPNFYGTHYNGVHRSVNVDFNALDIVVNVESWVVVFDFFGVGSEGGGTEQAQAVGGRSSVGRETRTYDSELEMEVRSLTLVLNRPRNEVARANVSQLSARLSSQGDQSTLSGRLGSMSLLDLTPGCRYRERFVSSGQEALNFHLVRHKTADPGLKREFDSRLKLEMSSVIYVHTQRFVAEITSFFREFGRLQAVIQAATAGRHVEETERTASRLLLQLHAGSPVILLPLSSLSSELLVADLGKLTVSNSFQWAGGEGTNATPRQSASFKRRESPHPPAAACLLDVMQIELVNVDLYAGRKVARGGDTEATLEVGELCVNKEGPSLLQDKCRLKLQVDRNLDTHISRHVPDMSIRGTLSTLNGAIDLQQYKLIRGLLSYNIGENLDQFYPPSASTASHAAQSSASDSQGVWTSTLVLLDLNDVAVRLQLAHGTADRPEQSLACFNFIKSRLLVETFSDRSQDVDLVSREILITDTRFQAHPVNKRSNVFPNILKPMRLASEPREVVQAEIHHRRRREYSKFTILLNNMRLMAILDWWETVVNFILENADDPTVASATSDLVCDPNDAAAAMAASVGIVTKYTPSLAPAPIAPFELKLNVTDSQVVLVEDTSQWDTNAVILKSTTVISYRPRMVDKPLSCNLNHLELFSCMLPNEEETALSIIDPVTINLEVTRRPGRSSGGLVDATLSPSEDRVLEIQMPQLNVRLSYHDFRMFAAILHSLPKQTSWARSQDSSQQQPANVHSHVSKLSALGFAPADCSTALDRCNGHLDDAALWLTSHATPLDVSGRRDQRGSESESTLSFHAVELKTSTLCVSIIDDCGDADVPLLELSLSQLSFQQELNGPGQLRGVLASDYFNRVLSGWEPLLEPWRGQARWEHCLGGSLARNRLHLSISADEVMNVNVTNTLLEQYEGVKHSWTKDYYNTGREESGGRQAGSPLGYRRRTPFVPYEVSNETGSWLRFVLSTLSDDRSTTQGEEPQEIPEHEGTWVSPGETVDLPLQTRGKVRHSDSHKLHIHQLRVKVEGWRTIGAISIDKVGVYFWQAKPEVMISRVELPECRVVLEVRRLKESAKKQVVVRSALLLHNKLADPIELKLDHTVISKDQQQSLVVPSGSVLPVPLSHVMSPLFVRPLVSRPGSAGLRYTFSSKVLSWAHVAQPGAVSEEIVQCHSNNDFNYRFCASVRRDNYPVEPLLTQPWVQPAHTITLLAPLAVINTLPVDLQYSVGGRAGHIRPGVKQSYHHVNVEQPFEVTLSLENYPVSATLHVPYPCNNFSARLRVSDPLGRRLNLLAHVRTNKGQGLLVMVCVPYWVINKTELPLVFRQEGDPTEAAGQFDEHEMARMVAPLLFSFSDPGASTSVVARIGRAFKRDGTPQWCQQFHLQPGVQIRRLHVNMRNNRPDFVYVIGVEVRTGRGRYSTTNIVNLTPRYQLYNRSQYNIQFAQKCFATTITDPLAEMTYLQAVPDCSLPFHWPRLDKDALLCLRLTDMPGTSLWSGGFVLDSDASFHVNVRDPTGRGHFILVEVALARATYHIVLTDAGALPAPLRIDNFSEVPLTYYQSCVSVDRLHGVARPHSTVPYAWDEPTQPPHITLLAPGGAQASYNMCQTGEQAHLTYENFIYIALTGTFNNVGTSGAVDPLDVASQQLVLAAPEGSRVVLARKQQGARAQLWRMSCEGLLQHEGSSPPSERGKRSDNMLVLDIQGPAPQPLQYSALVLRRPDKRRKTTQTWRFTEDGRLCCAHNNMCVQAKDGFFGLRGGPDSPGSTWQMWSEAVLGPPQAVCHRVTEAGLPLEQAVSSQKMRPGSGYLIVEVKNDGPTRVLEVRDVKEKRLYATADERDWTNICASQRPRLVHDDSAKASLQDSREMEVSVELPAGLGVSLVSWGEELVYCRLAGINLCSVSTPARFHLDLTVRDLQVDNQQVEAQCPVVMYVSPSTPRHEDPSPAVYVDVERQQPRAGDNAEVYDHLIVKVKNLSLTIEERLLLKLFVFAGWKESDNELEDVNEIEFETQRLLSEALSLKAKRYHFGTLQLQPSQVRLSVMTSSKMAGQLRAIKRKLGMRLIKFEDASVELQPFIKNNCYETRQFILMSVLKHFKEELRWQAATILGSVDFLGNPLGFMQDVSEGVTGLIRDGNVVTLVKNVTHGLSNSAAKVTESLSDGLGRVILDDSHEETRLRIRAGQSGSSGDHLLAGLKGLGLGLLGGVTSVFKQSYEGAAAEGVPGFIAGLGKGLVGTVTKPMVGMLDLASEAASAVRDSSRSSSRAVPCRMRPPRCVTGPGTLLVRYSKKQAQGQEFLYQLNDHNYSEVFICYEVMRSGTEDFRIVISNEKLRIFSCAGGCVSPPVIETSLGHLICCRPVGLTEENHYVELTLCADEGHEQTRKPKVRCDGATVALEVVHLVKYAKRTHDERKYTLEPSDSVAED